MTRTVAITGHDRITIHTQTAPFQLTKTVNSGQWTAETERLALWCAEMLAFVFISPQLSAALPPISEV